MDELTPTPEQRRELLNLAMSYGACTKDSKCGAKACLFAHGIIGLVREVERYQKAIEASPCAPDCASRMKRWQPHGPAELEGLACNCWKSALAQEHA